jgi:hypothetical protein
MIMVLLTSIVEPYTLGLSVTITVCNHFLGYMNEHIYTQQEDHNTEEKIVERDKLFSELYDEAFAKGPDQFLEYRGPFAKHEFLDFLVREKGMLLHGSNFTDLRELEPRQGNDSAKESGNLNAVYATEDVMFPILHAIKDKNRCQGVISEGYNSDGEEEARQKVYSFQASKNILEEQPWSEGVVYIFPHDGFEQVMDNDGTMVDEWVSRTPVRPVAKLRVGPDDFPYLNSIQPLDE